MKRPSPAEISAALLFVLGGAIFCLGRIVIVMDASGICGSALRGFPALDKHAGVVSVIFALSGLIIGVLATISDRKSKRAKRSVVVAPSS